MLGNEHKVSVLTAPSQQQENNNERCKRYLGGLQKLLQLKHLRVFSYEDVSYWSACSILNSWLTDNLLCDGLTPLTPWWMAIPIDPAKHRHLYSGACEKQLWGLLILEWWETGTAVIPRLYYTYAHLWLVARRKPDWALYAPVWLLVLQEMENPWPLMPVVCADGQI